MTEYVDELNALALSAAIDDLRKSYEARLTALENNVLSLSALVQAQSQVIGDALQRVMGRGSTVEE